MTSTGLASPPQAALTSLEGPAAPPPVPEWPPSRRGRSSGNFEPRAVALSVFVHLLLILFLIVVARLQPPAPQLSRGAASAGGTGFDIVLDFPAGGGELAPITVPPAAAPTADSPPALVVPPLVRVPPRATGAQPTGRAGSPGRPVTGSAGGAGRAGGASAGAGAGAGSGTGAGAATGSTSTRDALRPGYRDPRLYAPVDEFPELRKTEHERYVEHLQSRIDAVNDSMGFESNRNRTTSDWTVKDADGDRWGLSPEGLHLGGVTIPRAVLPLPAATGDNQSLEEERERRRMREEIQRQEAERERAETERERIEATRRRAAEERAGSSGN